MLHRGFFLFPILSYSQTRYVREKRIENVNNTRQSRGAQLRNCQRLYNFLFDRQINELIKMSSDSQSKNL